MKPLLVVCPISARTSSPDLETERVDFPIEKPTGTPTSFFFSRSEARKRHLPHPSFGKPRRFSPSARKNQLWEAKTCWDAVRNSCAPAVHEFPSSRKPKPSDSSAMERRGGRSCRSTARRSLRRRDSVQAHPHGRRGLVSALARPPHDEIARASRDARRTERERRERSVPSGVEPENKTAFASAPYTCLPNYGVFAPSSFCLLLLLRQSSASPDGRRMVVLAVATLFFSVAVHSRSD